MSGTETAYAGTRCSRSSEWPPATHGVSSYAPAMPCPVLTWRMLLPGSCAMSGTDLEYHPMQCPVLTRRLLLPGDILTSCSLAPESRK
eukprot:1350638-Rhodomonas_salina.1